jgi:hypothetical protein
MIKTAALREAYDRLPREGESVRYAIGAMQPIDDAYTQRTIEDRTRVEKQLADGFTRAGLGITFDYQGSVTNDTHIRAHSDLDLLTVDTRFEVIEPPNKPRYPYSGDSIANLREIRNNTVDILQSAFPAAEVDDAGSKAVSISGGSLRRKVDLIASAWWQTVEYVREPKKHWLGIHVLDNEKSAKLPNKPFLHNKLLDDRDTATNGGLRKLVRLLKSVKYDNDPVLDITSYDIAAIVYNMPEDWLMSMPGQDLRLIKNCRSYLHFLAVTPQARDSIQVPNKMRRVFASDGASEAGLRGLTTAFDTLVAEIDEELRTTARTLTEAKVFY